MSPFAPMTSSTINVLKGAEAQYRLMYFAPVDPGVTVAIERGMVLSLNAAGRFVAGVGNSKAMPMFAMGRGTDFDVNAGGPNIATDPSAWVGISPSGKLAALVCGDYEISTTAFVAGTYAFNQFLTSTDTGANAGLLSAGVLGTNTICGIVSRPVGDNGHGYPALSFWTKFLPNV